MLRVHEIEDLFVQTVEDWDEATVMSDAEYRLIMDTDRELRDKRPPEFDWSWEVFD